MQPDVLARTVVLAITLFNQLLIAFGHTPVDIEDENIYVIVSTSATVIASIVSWWKDNPFTKNAKKANEYFKKLKAGEADGKEV